MMAVEIKIILALLAFFLFRKAIMKAHCRRLKRLRMLLMSRQGRRRSVLTSLPNNSAATKRVMRQSVFQIIHIWLLNKFRIRQLRAREAVVQCNPV